MEIESKKTGGWRYFLLRLMETKITKNYNHEGYEQALKYLVESKTIYFIDCTCGDFAHRRMRPEGKFSDTKIFADPCKHLLPIVKVFESQGLIMKKPKPGTKNFIRK